MEIQGNAPRWQTFCQRIAIGRGARRRCTMHLEGSPSRPMCIPYAEF
jgi:hypothetical protein